MCKWKRNVNYCLYINIKKNAWIFFFQKKIALDMKLKAQAWILKMNSLQSEIYPDGYHLQIRSRITRIQMVDWLSCLCISISNEFKILAFDSWCEWATIFSLLNCGPIVLCQFWWARLARCVRVSLKLWGWNGMGLVFGPLTKLATLGSGQRLIHDTTPVPRAKHRKSNRHCLVSNPGTSNFMSACFNSLRYWSRVYNYQLLADLMEEQHLFSNLTHNFKFVFLVLCCDPVVSLVVN